MGKQSEAKKKRRQKRLEFRKIEEKANQNFAVLSESFKLITKKLKESDEEFAEAHSVFESLKDKYLFEDEEDMDNISIEEREHFDQAFKIVMTKQVDVLSGVMKRAL